MALATLPSVGRSRTVETLTASSEMRAAVAFGKVAALLFVISFAAGVTEKVDLTMFVTSSYCTIVVCNGIILGSSGKTKSNTRGIIQEK